MALALPDKKVISCITVLSQTLPTEKSTWMTTNLLLLA